MSSKIFYCTKVVAYGILCIITKLEFFQHHFSKMGHGNTSCDPHLHLSHQATNAALPHAQRPPPGGYVLTRLPDTPNTSSTTRSAGSTGFWALVLPRQSRQPASLAAQNPQRKGQWR